jgi:diguanylate cyclase (GGDEF)-like protein
MIVLTRHQDHVETINRTLRNAGHAVHVHWLPSAADLGDALTQIVPDMLVIFADEGIVDLPLAMDFRRRFAPEVPVLVVRDALDEGAIAEALRLGAQDAVTLSNLPRLALVAGRELATYRLGRSLKSTLASAREYQRQLNDFLRGSNDAIAQVQEGILVDANPAWLELFGRSDSDSPVGSPLMDTFDPDSHAALKGALVACLQGRWSDHSLTVDALLTDGSALSVELRLSRGEFEGEPSVRLVVAAGRRDNRQLEDQLADAVQRDPATGFLHRRYFLEQLRKRLAEPPRSGLRYLAYVEPDKYDAILGELGVLTGEDFLVEFARVLREQLQAGDLAGRFAGNGFMILLERGNLRDLEAWAELVARKVSQQVFQMGNRSISSTCTIGLAQVPASLTDPSAPASDAFNAQRRGRDAGGNRVHTIEQTDTMIRLSDSEKIWVRRIKAALMENRFRLVQQPIASLLGDDRAMFDVLVRMLDEAGDEVLPSEFMPVAERNDLMKNIDRWVIGASMRFCASRRPGALFVRLSADSLGDGSLHIWLSNQLKAVKIDSERMVFQLGESVAAGQIKEAAELQQRLHGLGFRFALEGFGAGRDTDRLLDHLKPDFVKVHGGLMQGLATNQENQQRVKQLVDLARRAKATTIAERVEDANTMAVLWQLGVEYIQGYFVNAPEAVTIG